MDANTELRQQITNLSQHIELTVNLIEHTMSSAVTSPRVCTAQGSKFIEMFSDATSLSTIDSPTEAKWTPLTAREARYLFHSQLPPGAAAVHPVSTRPPMPQSEINRLAWKIGRENTLQRTLHYIPPKTPGSGQPNSSPDAPPPKWTPLTESEARPLIQSKLQPSFSSPSSKLRAAAARPPMPQSEINRLAWKIGRENVLQRTLHYIPAHVAPGSATPDQRILHAHRRKSYTGPVNEFERDGTALW
ncbi:hypothetical protein MSAN_00077900 [Mycena sanguinolenta]|uniref:Uncharacterized protein n=1 Tax=Mycena sanguinolenta TaxID=230812 RepID=A0A8H6ZFT0_9AGAR|nr:hypothetical protein MSAN_00077900 [Mycena sanguinolenta]